MSAAATGGGIGGSGDDDMEIWKTLAKIVDLSSSDEDDDDDDHEPIRRGLAKHYSGKSRSFRNFKELEGLTMKELGKKRRRSKNQGQHDVEDNKVEKMKKKKKN